MQLDLIHVNVGLYSSDLFSRCLFNRTNTVPRGDENTDALNRSLDSIKEKLEHFGLTARSYSHGKSS